MSDLSTIWAVLLDWLAHGLLHASWWQVLLFTLFLKHFPALVERGTVNYWGYNSIGFFVPERRYAATDDVAREFKSMVKTLHAAGTARPRHCPAQLLVGCPPQSKPQRKGRITIILIFSVKNCAPSKARLA